MGSTVQEVARDALADVKLAVGDGADEANRLVLQVSDEEVAGPFLE